MAAKSSPSRPKAGTPRLTSEPGDGADDSASPDAPHYLNHRERLRARFLAGGAKALADYELLELVLFAVPRRDMKPVAKALMRAFDNSFADVIAAPPEKLRQVPGVGDTVVATLKSIEAAALLLTRARIVDRPVLGSWQALLDHCAATMGRSEIEEFRVLFLDRKNVLIAEEAHRQGTVDHTPVYPREVVKRALELGASALIVVHNHPSGDPTPSRADIAMTRELAAAARALRIELHDHLVIGRGTHASFKALGLL